MLLGPVSACLRTGTGEWEVAHRDGMAAAWGGAPAPCVSVGICFKNTFQGGAVAYVIFTAQLCANIRKLRYGRK